jgi:G:T-mismatch repair DNA endonuclease (very short patch repair protein)
MTISNTPIASTNFSRFFHDHIEHTHSLDWLQQVFPWLCQTHPSPGLSWKNLLKSVEAMGVFDIVLKKSADVRRSDGCVWYNYIKHSPLQLTSAGFSMTISNTPIASTDFSRFFHDYQTHPSPWLTSAGFSMTISNTSIASTDFSRKNLLKSVEAMGVFDIVLKKSADVRRSDGCVWYSHRKTCWSQLKRCVLDKVMEKPAEVSWRGVCLT